MSHKPIIGYDGRFELGDRLVDDPYEPGKTINVPANVRHDPLERMRSRNEIDLGQYMAGERLRQVLEAAGAAGAPAADYTRPFVDASFKPRNVAAERLEASKELSRACRVLGWQQWRIVRAIVCDGLNGSLVSQARDNDVDRKHVMATVRDGLQKLGILWGYLSGPEHASTKQSMLAWLGERPTWEHAEHEVEIEYHRRVE